MTKDEAIVDKGYKLCLPHQTGRLANICYIRQSIQNKPVWQPVLQPDKYDRGKLWRPANY
jgi:hypothetical protein